MDGTQLLRKKPCHSELENFQSSREGGDGWRVRVLHEVHVYQVL